MSTALSGGGLQNRNARRQAYRTFVLLMLVLLVCAGCARRRPVSKAPRPVPPTTRTPPTTLPAPVPARVGYVEEGLASWYGVPYHGRRTSNGEIYDMYKLTAAHRTLPFDTVVRVTNKKNGRKVEVRINDRGPFVEGRILDLSLAAARQMDMVAAGVVSVRLEVVSGPNPLVGFFTVQVGAFQVRENAVRLRQRLEQRYQPIFVQEYDSPKGLFYRVRVGRLPSEEAAKKSAEKLRRQEGFVPFVVRLDEN